MRDRNPVGDNNHKLGGLWSTYSPVGTTCPPCPMLGAICYAEQGNVAYHARRASESLAARVGAVREAARQTARRGLPAFRLHVSGDWHLKGAVDWRYVHAVRAVLRAYGVRAWCYTHEPDPNVVARLRRVLGPWCCVWHSDRMAPNGAPRCRSRSRARADSVPGPST